MNAFLVKEALTDGSMVYAVEISGLVRLECLNEEAAIALETACSGLSAVKILPPLASDCAEGIYREGWADGAQFDGDFSNLEGSTVAATESWSESYARQMYPAKDPNKAGDRAMMLTVAEHEVVGMGAFNPARDHLCALWINEAPRFGAVAAHFPKSLRKRRFVAGFWAPEVFFSWPSDGMPLLGWYRTGGMTRSLLDETHALQIEHGCPGPARFWSPELPEVVEFAFENSPFVHCVARLTSVVVRSAVSKSLTSFLLLLCLALPGVRL